MNMLRISPVGAMDIRQGCSKTEPLLHDSQNMSPVGATE